MDMIEKVAMAIQGSNVTSTDGSHSSRFSTEAEIADWYRKQARAAIEAMREPTAEMVKAAWTAALAEDAAGVWELMIDAALSTRD